MDNPKKRVLVIDDDHDILEIISMVLDSAGCEVLTADNGHEVNVLIERFDPDIILLDVMVGDMDGRDICKALKSAPKTAGLPIIIVSATHGWHTRHEKDCDANQYISKPFDIDDLVKEVFKYT